MNPGTHATAFADAHDLGEVQTQLNRILLGYLSSDLAEMDRPQRVEAFSETIYALVAHFKELEALKKRFLGTLPAEVVYDPIESICRFRTVPVYLGHLEEIFRGYLGSPISDNDNHGTRAAIAYMLKCLRDYLRNNARYFMLVNTVAA